MVRIRRASTTGAVIVCLLSTQSNAALFASELLASSADPAESPYVPASGSVAQSPTTDLQIPAIAMIDQQNPESTSEPAQARQEPVRLTLDSARINEWLAPAASGTNHGFHAGPSAFAVSSGQVYVGPPYPMHHNDAAIAALAVGAIAVITGTAVLVYANRPECSINPFAGGCGYGTKVVGTAVLSGGIVGLFIGALTWH